MFAAGRGVTHRVLVISLKYRSKSWWKSLGELTVISASAPLGTLSECCIQPAALIFYVRVRV